MIRILATGFAGLLGLAFGSFLNVCVSRWPEGESVVAPRSHCRACAHTLAWWENVPLVSWVLLRGRCRGCGAVIGWRYPLVELSVGGLWAFVAWRGCDDLILAALPPQALWLELARILGWFVFLWLMVALAALDAENLWLPNALTFPGIVLGFLFSIVPLTFTGTVDSFAGIANIHLGAALASLMSILSAAGAVLLLRWLYGLIRHREGMGLGDVKLMALLAAWLGLSATIVAFLIGTLLGAIAGIVVIVRPKLREDQDDWATTRLPFGTFLCIGGIVSSLWGASIIGTYMRWAGF